MSAEMQRLTPRQRLSISRQMLIEQLNGSEPPMPDIGEGSAIAPARRDGKAARARWVAVVRHVARRWWRRHPAHAAGQLALPVLERYAREHPVKLLAAAAATGALAVLAKPWRLLSVTAVMTAVFKSSDVADLVNTLMQKATHARKEAP
jgi:hypothetical protein